MCIRCYKEYGSPVVINTRVQIMHSLIASIYENVSDVGGSGHIVFDDWNLDDENVKYCIDNVKHLEGRDYPEEIAAFEVYTLTFMLALTEEERATALALHEDFIDLSSFPYKPFEFD